MTMQRKSVVTRMQTQKSPWKRSASVVPPSPKRIKRGITGLTHSPRSSPLKGLFIDSDTDSPTFMTRSFYGGKKRVVAPPLQTQFKKSDILTPSSSSPMPVRLSQTSQILSGEDATPSPVIKTSPRRLRSTGTKGKAVVRSESQQVKGARVVLSPLKGPNSNSQQEQQLPKAVVIRKRHRSLPAKVHHGDRKQAGSASQKDSTPAGISTPVLGRRFFKHKSPASASKAMGAIIIGKGFNLKFVPRTLNKEFKHSSRQAKSPREKPSKKRPLSRVEKTYSRTSLNNGLKPAAKETQYDHPSQRGGRVGAVADSQLSPITSQSCSQETLGSNLSDDGSMVEGSHSLFSSDTQSLASDVSGFVERQPLHTQDSHSLASSDVQELDDAEKKLSPVFSRKRRSQRLAQVAAQQPSTSSSPKQRFIDKDNSNSQLVLDAGQKKYGMTQCRMCGMVYAVANPADESMHAKFHQNTVTALKFPGWKRERVIKEFLDDGSRVICVLPEDQNFMTKKVEEVNHVMTQELGFPDQVFTFRPTFKAFFYVSDEKRIEGCCIAESIKEGYRVLPNNSSETPESQRPWFCSKVSERASLGIGRLWVYGPSRGRGIATRLVDCVRQWFEYGVVIDKSQVAFSDPTPDGRRFAAKYTGTPTFLVYKYIP